MPNVNLDAAEFDRQLAMNIQQQMWQEEEKKKKAEEEEPKKEGEEGEQEAAPQEESKEQLPEATKALVREEVQRLFEQMMGPALEQALLKIQPHEAPSAKLVFQYNGMEIPLMTGSLAAKATEPKAAEPEATAESEYGEEE